MLDIYRKEARAYCRWLAEWSGHAVRLPSEAEWECACRAGSETAYAFGDDAEELDANGWYKANSEDRAHEVGTLRPNRWGLYDLHGNAWEWCEDEYHDNYEGAPAVGSAWREERWPDQLYRGGGWINPAGRCRSASRFRTYPEIVPDGLGIRPAFSPSED